MTILDFGRYALGSCVAAALLAGCGGSQVPIGSGAAFSQSEAISAYVEPRKSPAAVEAKDGNLLYVASVQAVSMFSYPRGKFIGSLSGLSEPYGMCTDSKDHVYVVDIETQTIREFNVAGRNPIRTLVDSPNWPASCAVNPVNGDLAVSGGIGHGLGTSSNIAIYKDAKGTPKVYVSQYFDTFVYCTYDNSGNLFATAGQSGIGVLAELAAGSDVIGYINVDKPFGASPDVQWVGGVLVMADPTATNNGPATFYQVKVSGSVGTVVDTFQLKSRKLHANGTGFWVHGNIIIYPKAEFIDGDYENNNIGFWDYRAGGAIKHTITIAHALTVMVARRS
jgi:hypothetical protein